MNDRCGQTKSSWMNFQPKVYPELQEDVSTDVCVVGAGIAGMTTALLLAYEGKSVVVLDDGPVGGGQTGRTTAHLSSAIDARYFEIERLHGQDGARLCAESHCAAIDCIERIVERENIDCGFERVDGYLFLGAGTKADELETELSAARRAGIVGLERLARAPFEQLNVGDCLRFPRQAQFHPLRYLGAIAEALASYGGRIYCGSHAEEMAGGRPGRVRTREATVVATEAIVVATNTPINDRVAIHTKQHPYRTYAITVRVPAGSVPHALFWDTEDPYHYVRLFTPAEAFGDGFDRLIVGGEDHKTGQADDADERYRHLEEWAREHFPVAGDALERWSGQVWETIDGVAFIGRNPLDTDNVFIATGDCGMGMTHGTIAGMLLTDLILQRENEWAALYDPSRKTLRAAMEFARENSNVAWQYTDWLTPGEVEDVQAIEPGSGAILRRGLAKVAVYRDTDGKLHERTAVCPHLGGVVQWNSCEHTWDCPVHGSRFDALGQVITGPANSNLQPVDASGDATPGLAAREGRTGAGSEHGQRSER
jgi:glycine/D-amino acid oxidase-like deaminating enzyme/nitrite reductase/ring-hydroxylating ferredoxin subunit